MGLLPVSGPGSAGIGDNSAEASYYTWVNQHNTLGLGNDVPISTGNENNALSALVDGKWVVLRVPYPLSFYAKGLDGRIDDPNAGWKGRGVWTTSGDRAPRPKEGGKGTVPVTFHFEFRPTPLTDFAPACRANPLGKPGAPRRAVPGSRCSVGLG